MKIIVTGATGMVGSEVVRQAIADKDIQAITVIVRKPMEIQHEKIRTIVHHNFLDFSNLSDVFRENDACLWCLGISQSQVSKKEYQVITYDYAVAAAKAMIQANPAISFLFLSGGGADSTEKSLVIFARVKGMTENALLKLGFQKIFIARPAGIKPIHKNKNTSFVNKIMIPLFPILETITPKFVITSLQLAKAMLHLAKHGGDKIIWENVDLKRIGSF